MKRIKLLFIAVILTLSAMAQHTYVIVAGVSNYGNDEKNLKHSTQDVKSIYKIFQKQKETTVAIITGENATGQSIEEKLSAVATLAKPEDKIVFFFSGHGKNSGFISYGPQLFRYETLAKILNSAKTKNIFCFIDACHSGSVINDANNNFGFPKSNMYANITFVVGCREDELSVELTNIGHGLFTQSLIKALRGVCDIDHNREITINELFRYIHKDVSMKAELLGIQQHPQLIGDSSTFNETIIKWEK